MSLNGLRWLDTSEYDIHLLPGLVSPQLKLLLRPTKFDAATGDTTLEEFADMAPITLSFVAQFAGAPDNHGVKINKDNGEVTVAASLPAGPRLRSFIVTATAKKGVEVTARIRVNIHSSIEKIWLTPSQLTVRKDSKNMRFSVLAQFDDGIIGDITNWSPFAAPANSSDLTFVHTPGSDKPVLNWPALPAGSVVKVNEVTGELRATAETGSATITVKHKNLSASATVVCAKPWTTPVTLAHLSGPGAREASFVPNILFLPDGFQERDKTEFERLVRFVVGRLTSRNRTRPFSALTGKINYFYAWVPSPDAGISVLNELDRNVLNATTAEGNTIELPSLGRGPANRWSMANLINEVGLPTPASDPIISALDQARIDAWKKLYGNQVTSARMQHLFTAWLKLGDRVILNERDTAFHMAFGSRPALDDTTQDHGLKMNLRRLHEDDFDNFLKNLRGPTGLGLSDLWSGKGKDNKLIIFLCRSNRVGGANSSRSDGGAIIGVSLGKNLQHRIQNGANGFDLTPDPIPTDPEYNIWLTVAHELGHSCGLGDEYGGNAAPPPPSKIAASIGYANLQDRESLLVGNSLSPDKLKWSGWPRIAKAGVLFINPKPVPGGKFALVLHDPKAARLKPGDIVRLRTRPLATAPAPTGRFKVESVTNEVVIAPLPGTTLDPAKFPRGSLVIVPVRRPDSNPAANLFGADLTLADEEVLIRIAVSGNPHNALPFAGEAPGPNDDLSRPCKNIELTVPTAATNFPNRAAPKPPVYSSWTIGIYENGGQHNCGIFRPTGICLMSRNARKDLRTNTLNLYDFCIICRYAIVDALDPTLHSSVEVDFVGRYGKRGAA